MKIPPWLLAPVLNAVYRLWCFSLRISQTGHETVKAFHRDGKPMVFPLWHDEFFPLVYVWKTDRIITMVSQSKDGEYVASLLESMGRRTSRGSSSRGGVRALLQVVRLMRDEHYNSCIIADGPRGPRHEVKDGAVFLAIRTPAHIVPIRIFMKRAVRFNSWDKFQLPLPFSRVHIEFGNPYLPESSEVNQDSLQLEKEKLYQQLEAITPPSGFKA